MLKVVKVLSLVIVAFMSGCAAMPGMPGHVSVHQSGFDKSTQISVEPGWIESWSGIKLGLTWQSTWPKDRFVLDAHIKGVKRISDGESLQFNVDGKIYKLASIDKTTDFSYVEGVHNSIANVNGQSFSSKRYLVEKDFVNMLLNAKDVKVRLVLDKEDAEGDFSYNTPSRAKPAFRDFMKEYDKYALAK